MMNLITYSMYFWGILFFDSLFNIVCAQPIANRVFSDVDYLPGIPIKITINVTCESSQDFTVIENFPLNWDVLSVSRGGKRNDNQIRWNQTPTAKGRATLSYKLVPPATANETALFQGSINDQSIKGSSTLNRGSLKPVGIFENHIFMWETTSYQVEFDESTGVYRITSGLSPSELNGGRFLYAQAEGDASIEAFAEAENPLEPFYATAALAVFDILDSDCLFFAIEIKVIGDGWIGWGEGGSLTFVQNYANKNHFNGGMRIVREKDTFSAYYYNTIVGDWVFVNKKKMKMTDPVYIGLYSHCGYGESTVGIFRDVKLEVTQKQSSVESWMLYL